MYILRLCVSHVKYIHQKTETSYIHEQKLSYNIVKACHHITHNEANVCRFITCGSLEMSEGCFPQSTHSPYNVLVLVWVQSQVTRILCIGGDKYSCAAGNALTCGEQDRERER